jgi:hypothetical protein
MASYDRRLQKIYGGSEAAVRRNLRRFTFTFPRKDGRPNNKTIYVNKHNMLARLQRVDARLNKYAKAHKTGYTIRDIGCFNWRRIRGSLRRSMHSGAIAVDINPAQNPMKYGKLVTDMPGWFVKAFEDEGFTWGGRWWRKDAMHFELNKHTEPAGAPYMWVILDAADKETLAPMVKWANDNKQTAKVLQWAGKWYLIFHSNRTKGWEGIRKAKAYPNIGRSRVYTRNKDDAIDAATDKYIRKA